MTLLQCCPNRRRKENWTIEVVSITWTIFQPYVISSPQKQASYASFAEDKREAQKSFLTCPKSYNEKRQSQSPPAQDWPTPESMLRASDIRRRAIPLGTFLCFDWTHNSGRDAVVWSREEGGTHTHPLVWPQILNQFCWVTEIKLQDISVAGFCFVFVFEEA